MRLSETLCLSLACCALIGCNEATAPHAPEVRRVMVATAQAGSFRPTIEVTGEVKARVLSDLSFRTGGRIVERLADVGDHVRAGQVLARVDDSVQRADLEISRAKLAAAEADLEQRQVSFNRYQELLKTRAIAQSTFDQSQEELVTAQGDVETAKANLETAEDTLSYTELTADADGIITARSIEVGQVVSAAQTAMTLAHDGPRDAVFNVYEFYFLHGAPEGEVAVSAVAGGHSVSATLREVSPAIDTTTGTIRVKLTLPDNAGWPLGTPVVARFLAPAHEGITLPWSAMASADGEPAVWVVNPQTQVVSERAVTLQRYEPEAFIVSAGVSPGEMVVTQGGQFLADGMKVTWEAR